MQIWMIKKPGHIQKNITFVKNTSEDNVLKIPNAAASPVVFK
jgi:hypothetical protein